MKHLVTGGAGFIGSHLISKLIAKGENVICLDNFLTGNYSNIEKWIDNPLFEIIKHDIKEPIVIDTDKIWHLACPASPIRYQEDPIETTKICFLGTLNMLELAFMNKSKILLASTSEIYGDPQISPQNESYRGWVNNIGIRSCYDEGKRIAESLFFDYWRSRKVDICIARIFNTYGPNMHQDDGRVVSNFICQALSKKPLTIYGDGNQTRSFCYVDDLVEGLYKLMESNSLGPINLGNPNEINILKLAKLVQEKTNQNIEIIHKPLPKDDPKQRKPDITLARETLEWIPKVSLDKGLDKTINYFKKYIKN